MTKLPLIIDCDPGVDDAVMLMMALASPVLDVRAITAVAGNVPLRLTSRNARMMCDLMGRTDIPVYAGCPRPMVRRPVTAEEFHGESGIAGLDPFDPETPLAPDHAVNVLIEQLRAAGPKGLSLVVTGPMTNVATAIVMAPDIVRNIDQLILMAGADTEGGNITPFSEFNVFADPHAAEIVLGSGASATLLSLDVTHQVRALPDRLDVFRAMAGERVAILVKLLEAANELEQKWKGKSTPMHDPSTIAWLLAPELFDSKPAAITVETNSGVRFGQTKVSRTQDGPHTWVTQADADGFFDLLKSLVEAA
ncbi:MAG: nucleoside hydrolase [Alphaproteobacteria bacterium]|nr:nucleoside hydrolase [Hyphomonas sp.]MBR9808788.1 nucleoside hydrolase [Alphaproteobacteria bacterium]